MLPTDDEFTSSEVMPANDAAPVRAVSMPPPVTALVRSLVMAVWRALAEAAPIDAASIWMSKLTSTPVAAV